MTGLARWTIYLRPGLRLRRGKTAAWFLQESSRAWSFGLLAALGSFIGMSPPVAINRSFSGSTNTLYRRLGPPREMELLAYVVADEQRINAMRSGSIATNHELLLFIEFQLDPGAAPFA